MRAAPEGWLDLARSKASANDHAEALELYERFYTRSRRSQTMTALRLYECLPGWADLAGVYPPADAALRTVRDDTARRLLTGTREDVVLAKGARPDYDDFTEICTISTLLADDRYPPAVFVELDQRRPEVARECAGAAQPHLVRAGRFDVAARYLRDPLVTVPKSAESLIEEITSGFDHLPEHLRPVARQGRIDAYTDSVRMAVQILTGVGEAHRAQEVQTLAVSVITLPRIRAVVAASLGAPPA